MTIEQADPGLVALTAYGWTDVVETARTNLSRLAWDRSEPTRAAAVVIVLFEVEGATHYVAIKRARRGRNAGQWALPGGKVEAGETELQAGLREAEEEVGLDRGAASVLGRLQDFVTTSGFVISPFVVAAERDWRPRVAADEVAAVHPFSVERLVAADTVRWVTMDSGSDLLRMFVAEQTRIHAPTGGILWQFRESLLGRRVSVEGLRQPDFTRT